LINVELESKRLNLVKNRLKHQMMNKKQLETISGVLSLD
jgi:hypothetical protein